MYRLPLFPLPAVLFPGARIPLHIFEPRYRRMVGRCLEFDRRFGLLYHDPDLRGPFLMEEGRVGTVAEIEEFRILPDGRSLIVAGGRERFSIREGIESEEPYYEGVVLDYHDPETAENGGMVDRRRRSLALFREVVEGLDERPDPERLPELDPRREVSFRLAPTIQIDPRWQQSLLELRDEEERLDRLDTVFELAMEEQG